MLCKFHVSSFPLRLVVTWFVPFKKVKLIFFPLPSHMYFIHITTIASTCEFRITGREAGIYNREHVK